MCSRRQFISLIIFSAVSISGTSAVLAKTVFLGNAAWLEVRNLTGKVVYSRGQKRRIAWKGLRLKQVGEGLESGQKSSATLILDQGLGTIHVSENTQFSIKTLHTNARGGRVTQLRVKQGQVRLKVRSMENPTSRLEIHTPAGIAGVRGTEFGVAVQPSGRASVATLSGLVDTTAQAQTVAVGAQLQNMLSPGNPPGPAMPLRDSPAIVIWTARRAANRVLLEGQTDPVNFLLVEGEGQDTDQAGNFNLSIPVTDETVLSVRVITPLGSKKRYELPIN